MKHWRLFVAFAILVFIGCDSDEHRHDISAETNADGDMTGTSGDLDGGGTAGFGGSAGMAGQGASGGLSGDLGIGGEAGTGGDSGPGDDAGIVGDAGTGGIAGMAGEAGTGGLGGDAGIGGEAGQAGMALNCEQPDGATCEAAGCIWTYPGCVHPADAPPCYRFNQVVCLGRAECVWQGNHCAPDPRQQACPDLRQRECIGQVGRCIWENDNCADRPQGPCEQLEEAACNARMDCRAAYVDGGCGEGDGEDIPDRNGERIPNQPARRLPPEEPCEPIFESCLTRMVPCADVPLDFCERTPGCTILNAVEDCPDGEMCEPVRRCVRDNDPRCHERERDACEADALCRLDIIQECGPDGRPGVPGRMPQDGDQDRDFDPNRIIGVPCEEEWACVPNADAPCEFISLEECLERVDCDVVQEERCDCDPEENPRADQGERPPVPGNERALPPIPARRIQPPPDECPCAIEEVCLSRNLCEQFETAIDCNDVDGCSWIVDQECACALPRPPLPCEDGDPGCAEPAPPEDVCPPECFGCFPD